MLTSQEIYEKLLHHYGTPPVWSDNPYQVLLEAILVQNTSWRNVLKVRENIGNRFDPRFIAFCSQEELQALILSCGFWKAKANAIKAITTWYGTYEYDLTRIMQKSSEGLRKELLSLRGIGDETADVMLVFAFHKPSFIIDTYTRRFLKRMGYGFANDAKRRIFLEEGVSKNAVFYGHYHWLFLDHGKIHCKKQPLCSGCPFDSCQREFGLIGPRNLLIEE